MKGKADGRGCGTEIEGACASTVCRPACVTACSSKGRVEKKNPECDKRTRRAKAKGGGRVLTARVWIERVRGSVNHLCALPHV